MRTPQTQREESIFDAARALGDATERRAFLERACAGDAALRARVDELLALENAAESFFTETRTALSLEAKTANFSCGTNDRGAPVAPRALGEEPIGTRIGRYKLLLKIGEGGCGVVYMAEQQEPVRRRVALKIIKLGMETKSVIARFEAERQALALMDHPHIARVFDAGATDRGPPYFVMELVRGVRVTDYCDQNQLGIAERLDLFIRVCHAIQHAHQKGVIHGDIKPSNIMVSLLDGTPVPKVIDFGISKATEPRLTDKLLFTAHVQLIGTPAYMSPEQADLTGLDIDTRSDIYSLGVVLYELLVGRTPFDGKQLLASGLEALRHTLREVEPPRPSAKFSEHTPEDRARHAAARRTDPAKLVALLHGDLDWIVMKALEKDRARRYETANGLAMDLQRYLANEPVLARPPSRIYRLRKLVRRNRGVFAAGGAVAAALVAGLGTSTWLLLKERDARQRAVAAEQQEARLRRDAQLGQRVTQAALAVSQDRFPEADALLVGASIAQPTVEGAAVFRSLGEWHATEGRWKLAAERFGVLLRVDPLDGRDVSTLDYLRQGPALLESGDLAGYERFRDEAIARFAAAPIPFGDRIVKVSLLLPASERQLAALRPFAEATAAWFGRAEVSGDPFMAAWRSMSLALWEYRRGDFAKAREWAERCLNYPEPNAPRNATAHVILALALQRLGELQAARVEFDRAAALIGNKFKAPLDRGTPIQGFWFDWVFARILLREAESWIETAQHEP